MLTFILVSGHVILGDVPASDFIRNEKNGGTMSQLRLFSVLGDTNVIQNMTTLNMASREAMQKAQLITCPALRDLASAVDQIRSEANVFVYAAITEHLLAAPEGNTIYATVDPVFREIRDVLFKLCVSRPDLQVVLAPPLYRSRPFWYRQQLPEVATQLSQIFTTSHPDNFHVLPSFINQDSVDGINLTPVSGLHYVLFLFDKTEAVLSDAASAAEAQLGLAREVVRSHDDRIAYLEHDHSQLGHEYSLKVASDAEFADWVENRADEDWMTVQGLPRLSAKDGSDWQVQVKRQIRDLIKQVLQVNRVNFGFEIVYVHNPLRQRTTGPTLYNVQLSSADTSRRIRELYSGFFRRNNPHKLPSNLKGIAIRNKVTIGTRIRIAIMRQLGANYKASNPGLLTRNTWCSVFY